MSKTSLKKTLNSLTRDQIMEVVLDLYEARKEAREYLEYFISPDEKRHGRKTIATISKEFSPTRGKAKARTSVCRRAIKDFTLLHPSSRLIASVRLHYIGGNHKVFDTIEMVDKRVFGKSIAQYALGHAGILLFQRHYRRDASTDNRHNKNSEGCRAHTAKEAIETYRHFCIEKGITPVTG